MDNNKKISDWKYILLDTSFIIDYLSNPEKFDKNPQKQKNILLAKAIMKELSLKKGENKPHFYVTSITIGELIKLETASIVKKIVEIFYSGDVTILSYGKNEAEELNKFAISWKKAKSPNKSLKDIEQAKKESGCINYRAWINDDMKILSCAKRLYDKRLLDIILTSDEKTFFSIAEYWELPCRVLNDKYFPKDLFGELDTEQ
ncbi:MAG: hypothetical protein LBP85_05680 [Prevotellaceae bacterium]|jgi:hypothetical protein|nr:hypothetical protein [Prevotellaceae bacterium]